MLIAGHGRLAAMQSLSRTTVPAIVLSGLSAAVKNALRIADNRLAEEARWDRELLHVELKQLEIELPREDLDLTITGFEVGEVDGLETDLADKHDPLDDVPPVSRQAISRRVTCGSWVVTGSCAGMPARRAISTGSWTVGRPGWRSPIRPTTSG